jgi:16S rRNA processing protein RimM
MQPHDTERPDFLSLGRINGFFGVKGWVKVFSDTQPRSNIIQYPVWWLKGPLGWKEHKVVKARPHGKTIIACLEGVGSRETAAALIGMEIGVPREALPDTADGEYYWADLIGCQVVTTTGEAMGQVERLFETGANDVLVTKAQGKEILIPWVVPDVIVKIDLASRQLTVDWDPDY